MRYCPNCGSVVRDGEANCRLCGYMLGTTGMSAESAQGSVPKGLRAAIITVACLCVITAVLWGLWPKLSSASPASSPSPKVTMAPAPKTYTSPSPTPTPRPTPAPTISRDVLQANSWWKGTMNIANYLGDSSMADAQFDVWAFLGQEPSGKYYFEIFDTADVDQNTSALASFYVTLYADHIVPIVSDGDGWFFLRTLDESDVFPLTLYPRSDQWGFSYYYVAETEACDIYCTFWPID